jgi:DNA-binding transcriptional LysR family regulator
MAEMDDFAFAAHSLAASTRETLRIGVYGNGLADITDQVLLEYRRRYPEIELRIHDADFRRGIGPVLGGAYQAALLRAPVALPELRTVPVFREPIDALLPADHPLASADSIAVEELFGDPWVTFPPSIPGTWATHWLAGDRRADGQPIIGVYARSEYEIHAAIAYQVMVGLLPRSSLRLRPHAHIASVPVRHLAPSTAAVVMPASAARPAALALASIALEVARASIGRITDAEPAPEPGTHT